MTPQRLAAVVGAPVDQVAGIAGGDICQALRVGLTDGRRLFAKTHPAPPPGFFAAEAAGLRWLGDAGAPVPGVVAVADDVLVLEWVAPGAPRTAAAEQLGRALAALHRAPCEGFGAGRPGYIGTLPLDNTGADDWPTFYAERRVLPYLRQAPMDVADRRAVDAVLDRLAALAGPPEPARCIHGDLWSGNVLWAADGGAVLIDPAAHGGHRETDLAMLALFGTPHLDRILASYDEVLPLADGWRERVPLHQLHPLLVHAVLFGGGYGARAGAAARALL